MVIAVYLPSCLSQLSSGSVAKIWQSVSAHAERGNKLDGNYGLGFLGWRPKKAWDKVIWKWKREWSSSWTFKVLLRVCCCKQSIYSTSRATPSLLTNTFFFPPSFSLPSLASCQIWDRVSEIGVMKEVSLHQRVRDKPFEWCMVSIHVSVTALICTYMWWKMEMHCSNRNQCVLFFT